MGGLLPEAIKGQESYMAQANSIMWVAALGFQMLVSQTLYSLPTDEIPKPFPYLPQGWFLNDSLLFMNVFGIVTVIISVALWNAMPLAPTEDDNGRTEPQAQV